MQQIIEQIKQTLNQAQQFFFDDVAVKEKNVRDAKAKINTHFDYAHLANVLPYQDYDEKTQLFHNQQTVGFVLSLTPMIGGDEESVSILASILTDVLPPETDLQVLQVGSHKIGHILDAFQQSRSSNPLFSWLAQKRVDYLRQGAWDSLVDQGQYLLRDVRVYLTVTLKKKPNVVEQLLGLREDIQSTLTSIHMSSSVVNVTSMLMQLQELLSPSQSPYPSSVRWQPLDELALQVTDPECTLQVAKDYLYFEREQEKTIVNTLSVKEFPDHIAQWQMGDQIGHLFNASLQMPCPFITSFHIRILPPEKTHQKVQLKFMSKDRDVRSPMRRFRTSLSKEHRDWQFVRDRLSEGDRLVKVHYQVSLYSKQGSEKRDERRLRDLYRANGWILKKHSYLQLPLFLANLPMLMGEGLFDDMAHFGQIKHVTAFNAANLAPLQGDWKGSQTPNLLLPSRRGQLSFWNPFDSDGGNYNMAIAAKSGSGKSVFTQEYLLSILSQGGQVWVIDAGRSYEKTCKLLGGTFLEFSDPKKINLNPFQHLHDIDSAIPMLVPLIAAMARPSDQLSDEEKRYIEQGVKSLLTQKVKNAEKAQAEIDITLSDLVAWFRQQDNPTCRNLGLLLFPYTSEGSFGAYFEGEGQFSLDHPLIVLELDDLKNKKDLQRIVLMVLMYHITQAMYLSDRKRLKSCIIDEAWDLMGSSATGGAAQFIEAGYRTARRYRGNFVSITQSINDYFKNPMSQAAYENADHKIILSQSNESISQLEQSGRIEMSPYKKRVLKSLRTVAGEYSEMLIQGDGGFSIHRLLLDPYSTILYSTKGEEFQAVRDLETQGYSLMEALEIVAKQMRGKPHD